jgi:hypothetical protein
MLKIITIITKFILVTLAAVLFGPVIMLSIQNDNGGHVTTENRIITHLKE